MFRLTPPLPATGRTCAEATSGVSRWQQNDQPVLGGRVTHRPSWHQFYVNCVLCVLMLCTFYFHVVTAVCQLLINWYVMLDPGLSVHYESLFTEHQLDKRQLLKRCFGRTVFRCSFFVIKGSVTVQFSVRLSYPVHACHVMDVCNTEVITRFDDMLLHELSFLHVLTIWWTSAY